MILAAGKGTRLGDLGRARAKVLIDVGGRPLLDRHLSFLESVGIVRVVINVSHLAEQVRDAARAYGGPLEIICLEETELLGTAGGVRNAIDYLTPGPFMVIYGDVLVQDPIAPMIQAHREHGAVATLAVHRADSALGKGTVETDTDGRIVRFAEKDETRAMPASVLINSGVYILEEQVVADLPSGAFSDFGHDVFPDVLARGAGMYAYEFPHPVIDIGTPDGLKTARDTATV
jgi:NDP-sugar pyrophosphorylase family protein